MSGFEPRLATYIAARMPQARKVLLDGCGHMSITEQPHNVANAVEDLIEH